MHFRSMKARKAKYGWDLGPLHLGGVLTLATFMKELEGAFSSTEYIMETVGMHNNELRLYTDSDDCADWIRRYVTINGLGQG